MKTINIDWQDLYPTFGAIVDGKRVIGLFVTEEDAASEDADILCWGTIPESRLTPEQIEIAKANTAEIESMTA